MIESLLASRPAWIQLGLVLAHFLWQGAAIAVVLAAMLWFLRRRSPNTRYGLCGLAMLTMAACPVLTLQYVRTHQLPLLAEPGPAAVISRTTLPDEPDVLRSDPADAADPVGDSLSAMLPGLDGASDTSREEASSSSASPGLQAVGEREALGEQGDNHSVDDSRATTASPTAGLIMRLWLPRGLELAALAWLIGVAVLSVRLVIGWLRLRRQYRRDTEGLPEAIEAVVRRLSERLGIARRVRVVAARAWDEPIAFGLLRPVVLMPVAMLTQCPVELIEAMIAHELAHIRRYDLWVNVFQRVVETVLFYHPAVWWVSGRMRLERELCCDDLAIYATGRRADYASALVELCRVQPGLVTPALAAGVFGPKLSLLTRVRRVLQASPLARESNRGRFWLAGPLSILLAGVFVLVAGLRAAAPQGVAATQPAEAASTSAFTATLPDGVAVELAGIGENQQPGDRQWWKPDGSPLDIGPYWRTKTDVPRGSLACDLAVRVTGTSDYSIKVASPAGKYAGEPWVLPADPPEPYRQLNALPGLHGFLLAPFKPDELETSVSVGLATGKWQRVYDWTGRPWEKGKPGTHTTRTDAGVAFVWPRSEGNTTTIEVSHTYADAATRLVAFDRAGKLFVGTDSHLGSGRGITTRLYTFSGLALQDVNGFEFQQRPYDSWITFNNVSVKPGHRTAVQVEITRDGAGSSQASSPAAAPSASESSLPFPKETYEFKWERVPLPKVLAELQEQTGLSVVGADDIEKAENWTISFASIRPVGFDEALLLINHLIQDKGVGYWIVRRDQCLEIRDVVSWFRRVPPAQMFTTEEAYQKTDLPKWEVASVVYQPRHASAKSLADRAMDEVPDNTARARPTPDGNRIELKGIVEYIDQQLEIIKKWDVPQDESAALLAFEKAAGSAGRRYSLYGSRSGTPEDNLITLYSSALSHAGEPPGVPVHARTDGVTVEVKVKNGQAVKKDDLLARFDDEEIKIDLTAAEIRFDECSKKLERLRGRGPVPPGPVPSEEMEKAESAARLAGLDLQRCKLRLDRTQIKSPADGVVVGRGAPENDVALLVNQQVKAGELLMYIRSAEQDGSTGTTAPKSRLGAAPKSKLSTRPEGATSLTELLDRRSPWLPQAQAGLEKAIRELEAAKEELRSSRFMTENHPRLMQLKKRIEDLRNALSPSVAAKKVYAQADGVGAEVKVQDGQTVKKDDLLVQLDAEEIKLERMAAQVKYDQAQTELERLAKLKEHSAVGQFEYQKVAADAKLAEIEVRRLDLRLSRTRITSPADGKVWAAEGNLSDLVGKRVTAGDLLLYVEPADSAPQANTRPSDSSSPDERPRRGRSPDERPRGGRY